MSKTFDFEVTTNSVSLSFNYLDYSFRLAVLFLTFLFIDMKYKEGMNGMRVILFTRLG